MTIDESFWKKLKEKYVTKSGPGENHWQEEEKALRDIIPLVGDGIKNRYKIIDPIGVGGSAVVITIHDNNLDTVQALKLGRPVLGRELLLSQIITKEISRLRETNHPNIVQIFLHGSIDWEGKNWPYYVMEFVEGGKDAAELIKNGKDSGGRIISGDTIISWVRQIAEGLAYLHKKGTLHGDVKLENTLIAPDGRAQVSDLGSARLLSDDEKDTILTFTRNWAHPELRGMAAAQSTADPNRVKVSIERSKLRTSFDMFSLGKNIFRLVSNFDPSDENLMKPYVKAYLELAAARLLDGYLDESECALGLPRSALKEIKYLSIDEFILDMRKLTGEYALHTAIPELDHHFPRTIQVTSPGPSPFSERLAAILEEPLIRRLGNISQLGLIVQVYPNATHSRLEHVLGTFSNTARYVDSLWNDPINPLFKQLINEHDVRALLVAALCHDIGHYPLAHDLAEADSKTFAHADIGRKILEGGVNQPDILSLRKTIKDVWKVEPKYLAEIFSSDVSDTKKPIKERILNSILDGPIDADKIDYLIRDSNNLGVPYGRAIDLERFLRCLTVTFREEARETFVSIGIHEKGKVPAEAIAFARYALFGTVYWHHTSRAMKAMLHMATWLAFPHGDRRSKEYINFKKDFEQFIFPKRGLFGSQQRLPIDGNEDFVENATYLHPYDLLMLRWIRGHTTDEGKKLIDMLCSRKVFKRLLVVSGLKNQALWDKMVDLSRDFTPLQKLEFQKEVQAKLVHVVGNLNGSLRTTSVLDANITDALIGRAAKGEILFLVDVPAERAPSNVELYFLSEKRIRDTTSLQSERTLLEDSLLWSAISKSFQKSVGKVRIFVHPDFDKTATAALSRGDIESALTSAYRKAA